MRFFAFLFLLVVAALGFASFWLQRRRRQENLALVRNWAKKFDEFEKEQREESGKGLYEWLMKRVLRTQKIITEELASSDYEDFLRDERGRTGRLLVDVLEQMGQYSVPEQRTVTVRNYLMRYIGVSEEEIERIQRKLINPVRLFREGIRLLARFPELMWRWATGREMLQVVLRPDPPRKVRRISVLAILGLLLPVGLLVTGPSGPMAFWTWLTQLGAVAIQSAGEMFNQLRDL